VSRALARIVLPLLLALAARAAQAQADSLPSRLAPAVRGEIARLADSTRIAGLPAEVLSSKAREGVLRGVDDARILAAVRAVAQRLTDARAALGPTASRDEIVGGADALAAGVAPDALRQLGRDLPAGHSRPLATALVVLADLVTRGVPAPVATETIRSLAVRGVDGPGLMNFRQSVELDIRAGRLPGDATISRGQSLLPRWDAPIRPPSASRP
jgi:hypothetical protein